MTKYQQRISGPLIDRIDIHIEVPRVDYEKLSGDRLGETSQSIRARVQAARDKQRERLSQLGSKQPIFGNADMRVGEIRLFCKLQDEGAARFVSKYFQPVKLNLVRDKQLAEQYGVTKTPTVVIVDERPIVGAALVALLAENGRRAQAIEPRDVSDLGIGDGVALVSVGDRSVAEVVSTLSSRGWKVVMYGCGDETVAALGFEAGAVGIVSEESPPEALLAAEQRAHRGASTLIPADERQRLLGHLRTLRSSRGFHGLGDLTGREREILDALIEGRRAADIAEQEFVSVATVRNQIQSILTKLNVNSQLEAVAVARRIGWQGGVIAGSTPRRDRHPQ